DGWLTANDAAAAGVSIEAVVDSRADASPSLAADLAKRDVRILRGAEVVRAHGSRSVKAIEVRDGNERRSTISCDALAMSGGWSPITHQTSHLVGKTTWNEALSAFVPGTL